jgi:hypothetical protein
MSRLIRRPAELTSHNNAVAASARLRRAPEYTALRLLAGWLGAVAKLS